MKDNMIKNTTSFNKSAAISSSLEQKFTAVTSEN